MKKPRMGRRRLVVAGIGVITILVGIYVLTNQLFVASSLQPYLGSALGSSGPAMDGFTPYGSLSYLVYAVGLGLIASGGALLRSMWRSSLASYASGGSSFGAMGMNPEAVQTALNASLARMSAPMATPAPQVKVKCRNCGSLEAEDAVYCRKCGKPV